MTTVRCMGKVKIIALATTQQNEMKLDHTMYGEKLFYTEILNFTCGTQV